MRLTKSRGMSRYPSRDYDAERAALTEGYRAEAAMYEQWAEEALSQEGMTAGDKKQVLERYRSELLRLDEEYRAGMAEIDGAQMEAYAAYMDGDEPYMEADGQSAEGEGIAPAQGLDEVRVSAESEQSADEMGY